MWKQLKRITKPNGAIVMTASQPFTTTLIASNMKMFRHQWVWDKKQAGNPFLAKIAPLKTFEDVLVFSQKKANYYPIMRKGVMRQKGGCKVESRVTASKPNGYTVANDDYYPTAIIEFSTAGMRGNSVHPTQKPVALMEYLIKTYTNEGDTVLDFTMGSGTTGVACMNTNRRFIGIELDSQYFEIAKRRIKDAEESNSN
jgi:site-specific DNA-methyltransferase (adenine-specific)